MPNKQNYSDIGREISTAEFKGMVLTKLEYIETSIATNQEDIGELEKANQDRKDWQENFATKSKIYIGVATFVGGIMVFIVDKLIDLWPNK